MSYFIVKRTNILLHNRVLCHEGYLISFQNLVKFSGPPMTKKERTAGGGKTLL